MNGCRPASVAVPTTRPAAQARTDMHADGALQPGGLFAPRQVEAWDASDTVPREMPGFTRKGRDTLPLDRALAVGIDGLYQSDPDQRAGWLACRQHANGAHPSRQPGREVMSIAHNRLERPGTGAPHWPA